MVSLTSSHATIQLSLIARQTAGLGLRSVLTINQSEEMSGNMWR